MSGVAWGALNLLLHFVQNPAPVYKQEDVWSLPMTDLLDQYSSSLWKWPEYTDFSADTVVEQRPKVILGGRSQNSHLTCSQLPTITCGLQEVSCQLLALPYCDKSSS